MIKNLLIFVFRGKCLKYCIKDEHILDEAYILFMLMLYTWEAHIAFIIVVSFLDSIFVVYVF